jgi:hypothetical protein
MYFDIFPFFPDEEKLIINFYKIAFFNDWRDYKKNDSYSYEKENSD